MTKKIKVKILLGGILSLFILSLFIAPVKGLVGTYEQRKTPANPLIMNADLFYIPASGSMDVINVETMYHQVLLTANTFYALLIAGGPADSDDYEMDFFYSNDAGIDDFSIAFYLTTGINFLLFIKPSFTGIYNLTLTGGIPGGSLSIGFQGIGFLMIPHKGLNELYSRDDWDFGSFSGITLGYINVDPSSSYIVATEEEGMYYYPSATVYRWSIDASDQFIMLSENTLNTLTCSQGSPNGFSQGYHVLYSIDGDEFGLMAYIEPTPSVILGYSFLWLAMIGIVSIMILIKKIKS